MIAVRVSGGGFAYHLSAMRVSAMRRAKKKTIDTVAIVGTGNVARVVALALLNAGVRVNEIITRDAEESKKKGEKLARFLTARASTVKDAQVNAKTIWICVEVSDIAQVAGQSA